jgi:hypothetical protein
MNERIKELKEQSMEWVPNMADPDTKIRLLNAEKFAELIVGECVGMLDDEDDYGPYSTGVRSAAYRIKKHFGVKE